MSLGKVRIAARGSSLSIAQVLMFASRLLEAHPGLAVSVRSIRTSGDRSADRLFHEIGVKGIFEKEVDQALLRDEADLAVHSLKDVPSKLDPGVELVAVLPRDPPYDVIVARRDVSSIDDLPRGAIVGTSSARRRAMLLHYRRDLRIKPLRGNVDTRLNKLARGEYDAVVLAEAGLTRLGIDISYARLPPNILMPAPCQGIIAVFARRGDRRAGRLASSVSDDRTLIEARAERALLRLVGGGCHKPFGCLAEVRDGKLVLRASLLDAEGLWRRDVAVEASIKEPEEAALRAARALGVRPHGM